jgi:microcystin degradation protein MlrC
MKVLVGGLHHESDTFNPIITGQDDISVTRSQELINRVTNSSCSGIIKGLQQEGIEVVPTLLAGAVPNGEWDENYYLSLKEELLEMAKNAGKIDAVCFALHGSMRVKNIGEAEGDLLEDLREMYPNIPIICSLDMHATITKRMMSFADAFVGYKCAPHTDTFETGLHAARITIQCLKDNVKPVMSAVHIPFIVAGEQSETSVQPMKKLMDNLRQIENSQEDILACSCLLGFPWADTEENGVTTLVVTDNNKKLSDHMSMELANIFWNTRKRFGFYNETNSPQDCLIEAKKSIKNKIYPVVISDSGDNPTAGSSQDVTNFLQLILADKEICSLSPPAVYQAFYDKEVIDISCKAGIGATIDCMLGAKYDKEKSSPVHIKAKVISIVKDWNGAGKSDLVLLLISGLYVVVTSGHVGCYDPDMMRVLGIEAEKVPLIIVKLGYLEPEIRAIAKRSMMALTRGSSDEIFSRLPYKKIKRPVYPLDGDFNAKLEYIQ